MRGTVRFRITALAAIVVAAVLAVTGAGLVIAQRRLLTEGVDETVEQRADDLEPLLATPAFSSSAALQGYRDEDIAVQVVSDGRVLLSNPPFSGRAPLAAPPPDGQAQRVGTSDGFRVLSRRVTGPQGPAVLHVGGGLSDVMEAANILRTSLLVAIPLVVALLAAVIWSLVGRTLRPVDAIRAEVATISGSDLHRRVPQPRGDDEVARLARTMNTMLDRVEEASVRQQRFVADASHELRSP